MKHTLRYFAAHPTAANILMFAIIIIGVVAVPDLNRETFPRIKSSQVSVTVPYPGASPSEVEEAICNRLEDATDGISFLDEQRCESRDGVGTLVAEMQEIGDIKTFKDDVQAAVDAITDFPEGVEQLTVKELGRVDSVVVVAITSDLNQPELKALAEYYRNQLLALPEVPIVTVTGFSQHEYSVLLKPEVLGQYQLSVEDVANLIRSQALDLPLGDIETHERIYQLRFENARRTPNELADLVVLNSENGGLVRLGDIATIRDEFEEKEMRTTLNNQPAAKLLISKNETDDILEVFAAIKNFVDRENERLPEGTTLYLTEDQASVVQGRLSLLVKNGWQGLLLAGAMLLLFFNWRYTFWVVMGIPVSFLGGMALMSIFGVSINMISMVALLMAIGILMDDAIVLSESIDHEYRKGKSPLEAAISGVSKVARGVFSSFTTSCLLFGSLLFLSGEIGQIMSVLPVVLLSVLVISLVEAFLILPNHLSHALEKHDKHGPAFWRKYFEAAFDTLRRGFGVLADMAIAARYLVVGGALGLFVFSVSLMVSGVVKFEGFPNIEGNILVSRILMPQGTPIQRTEEVVDTLLASLDKTLDQLPDEPNGDLIKSIQVSFGENNDANESGAHLATISLDLLDTELRETALGELQRQWIANTPVISGAVSIEYKEPAVGPGGRAISIRLQGLPLEQLSRASWELQSWLSGYPAAFNISDDLRPGKPQFVITLLPGILNSGLDAQYLSSQLRSAFQGVTVSDIYLGREAYEINVKLDIDPQKALADFEQLIVLSREGVPIPLNAIASIEPQREYSRIMRINHIPTVTTSADVDTETGNAAQILADSQKRFLPELQQKYPGLIYSIEGANKENAATSASLVQGFVVGLAGVYLLLSLQFQNYREPIVVLINIPLALMGVIWGHYFMGLDMTIPSMVGFVALSGVVVNDSILLVEFVKLRSREGMSLHEAAGQAVRDRFRAVLLTSTTTVAGMLPLLSESSPQAQILIPLVASIVFGMMASTVLILIVLPATYTILEDFGFTELPEVMEV